jgi:hypothetical protein
MTVFRFAGAMLLAAALHGAALAAPEPKAQAEIAHLLDYVATPGCRFNRNGSWHDGAEAKSHLQKKYDYLVKRKLVTNAESFIALAATESSMSGKPYQVKCGDGKAVASSAYLTEELKRFRGGASK